MKRVLAFLFAALSSSPAVVVGQVTVPRAPTVTSVDSAVVTPEGRYAANGIKRFFLGDLNRHLWEAEFAVPVIDLSRFAGGLTPTRRGGGLQTQSLRLLGADGLLYNFRSIDKDATRAMDPEIARTVVGNVRQDQIGALFPLSARVVAPLLRAAGVLHADPSLVVLPDDPALGEFQEEFAGKLGWIEVRPDEGPDGEPGFAGATRVTGSDRLLERLEEDPDDRVNVASFLRARLMDVYVGDWDRHPDQWRWAGFEDGESTIWEPIPRDRDWALAKLDGLLVYVAGWIFPHYKGFGTDYPSMYRATWTGRALDRHILPSLSRESFVEIAVELQAALTDEVIDEAVATLPATYEDRIGEELREAFQARRDGFVDMATEYYELLAGWVDIQGTDRRDLARVDRLEGDSLRVELYQVRQGEPEDQPYFRRVFLGAETNEVRIFMRGNDDRVEVQGTAPSTISVRVDGGGSDDVFVNESTTGKTYFYDDRGDNEFVTPQKTHVDEDDYDEPFDPGETTHQAKHRDWGHSWIPYPSVEYDSDEGFYVGAGAIRDEFGFRYFPWESRFTISGAIGGQGNRARAHIGLDAPVFRRRARLRLTADANVREVARFFGLGNDSQIGPDDDAFKFDRTRVQVGAVVAYPVAGTDIEFTLGGAFWHHRAEAEDSPVVDSLGPYGFPEFTQLRFAGGVVRDTRDREVVTTTGSLIELQGSWVPPVLDANQAYGSVGAQVRRFWSAEGFGQPTLSVRAGGRKVVGDAPYHDAALIGGSVSVLGLSDGRYAGDAKVDASVLGSLKLFDVHIVVPAEVGVLGVAGVGRVWVDGDSPTGWHEGYGGGLWVSFLQRPLMASITVATGDEEPRFYFSVGLPF